MEKSKNSFDRTIKKITASVCELNKPGPIYEGFLPSPVRQKPSVFDFDYSSHHAHVRTKPGRDFDNEIKYRRRLCRHTRTLRTNKSGALNTEKNKEKSNDGSGIDETQQNEYWRSAKLKKIITIRAITQDLSPQVYLLDCR